MPLISTSAIEKYAAGPSPTRRGQVKRLHEDIRKALDESSFSYETFLQGSYRNDTAIADINDVDIVALRKYQATPQSHLDWLWEFNQVIDTLRGSWRVSGSVTRGDKCVKVEGGLDADVVPALRIGPDWQTDPLAIYSIRERSERENFPRRHRRNGVRKQDNTKDAFKPTVRLFKRWVRQYQSLVAPSFYIECAVHSVPDAHFDSYLPRSFRNVARSICEYSMSKVIWSVAGDKDILHLTEWKPADFVAFQNKLRTDADLVASAITASTSSEANRLWKLAFGE